MLFIFWAYVVRKFPCYASFFLAPNGANDCLYVVAMPARIAGGYLYMIAIAADGLAVEQEKYAVGASVQGIAHDDFRFKVFAFFDDALFGEAHYQVVIGKIMYRACIFPYELNAPISAYLCIFPPLLQKRVLLLPRVGGGDEAIAVDGGQRFL